MMGRRSRCGVIDREQGGGLHISTFGGDMSAQSYRDLIVWRKAMDLAKESYTLTKRFPPSEVRGLTSQVQRAAVSVPSNIAEGNGRLRPGAYVNHLCIARGSLHELESDLTLAAELGYVSQDEVRPAMLLCDEVSRMLTMLSRSLKP
jgi:four helix bundle protein